MNTYFSRILLAFFITLFSSYASFANGDSTTVKSKKHSYNGFHVEICYSPVIGKLTEQFKEPTPVRGKSIELNAGCGVNERLQVIFAIQRNNLNVAHQTITNVYNSVFEIRSPYKIREEAYGIGLAYHAIKTDLTLSTTIGSGRFIFSHELPETGGFTTKFGYFGQLKISKHWWVSDKLGFSLSLLGGFLAVEEKYFGIYSVITSQRVAFQAASD